MKKIFVTLATIGLLSTGAFAADGGKKAATTVTVSYTVQNQFDTAFGDAKDVAWTITPNCQKASFTLSGVKMTAFYNLQGEYLGVTQDVAYAELDSKAQNEIAAKYKGYGVNEVIKLVTNDPNGDFEQTIYFVDLKNDASEVLLRVSPSANVYFFKQVK